jgi:hypothetical protein
VGHRGSITIMNERNQAQVARQAGSLVSRGYH